MSTDSHIYRLVLIAGIALAAHLATTLLRRGSARLIRSRMYSETKALTVTGFITSLLIFTVYFAAFGFFLAELGVSLTTYLASASVIGLAVSFGSQGVVQDVITGLTVVFTDLVDVGDMVELGGQVGIIQSVGMRFTVLVNFSGARVFIPNRSIANVISYPSGFIRAYVDIRLPADEAKVAEAEKQIVDLASSAYQRYPGILLAPPTAEGHIKTKSGHSYYRVKFRLWPGQGLILEQPVKQAFVRALEELDDRYADWMVTVHYRAEPLGKNPMRRLPRPSALRVRDSSSSVRSQSDSSSIDSA